MSATKMLRPQFVSGRMFMIAAALLCLNFSGVQWARAAQMGGQNTASPVQKLFATPEEALQALESAVKAKDRAALAAIFGPDNEKLESGDAVEDNNALDNFALRLAESATLQKVNDSKYALVVGAEKYPFPIPIVKQGEQWRFDTQAGLEEILNRRIGENELSAILTCRAYVLAQWQYYTESKDTAKDGLAVYAQKFLSTAGTHDGLYWDTALNEEPSPLGALVAHARAEGYAPGQQRTGGQTQTAAGGSDDAPQQPRSPYHGYFFKILTRQGPHAPGGRFSYIINGNMIAGYALIAWPAKWGSSGVMTFIVNNQGRIYEKNLGPNTAAVAAAISEYDPDPSWTLVKEE